MISKAEKIDAEALTVLTVRSKSYWGYAREQIEEWIDQLTITEKYIEENEVYKLVENNLLAGFYAYAPENQMDLKLNFFFVCPQFIGKGCGKLMLLDFLGRVENSGFERVVLDADPNAENFYLKHGFNVIGKQKSSIKNRFLPILAKALELPIKGDKW